MHINLNLINYKSSLLIFITCLYFFSFSSCKSSKFTGETKLLEPSQSGQLALIAGGYGSTKVKSVDNAIENAFKNILLHGIPESNQSSPLLGKNALDNFEKNKPFLENMLSNDIERFVLDKTVSDFKFLNLNEPSTNVKLKINLNALRSHLEQNGIIRAFGL